MPRVALPERPEQPSLRRPSTSDSSPARTRAPGAASTSLRCTWTIRSAWSRTNATGSVPPISRWPVSRHQPHVGVGERRARPSSSVSTSVPTCGCSASVEAVARRRASVELGEVRARSVLPLASSSAMRRAPVEVLTTARRRTRRRRAAASDRARRGAPRRGRRGRARAATSGTNPPTRRSPWRSRSARSAAASSGRKPCGAELGGAAGRARPSRRARARAGAAGPSRAPRRRPTRWVRRPAGDRRRSPATLALLVERSRALELPSGTLRLERSNASLSLERSNWQYPPPRHGVRARPRRLRDDGGRRARGRGLARARVARHARAAPRSARARASACSSRRRAPRLPARTRSRAASPATGRNTVGVLLNDLHNPFFAEIADGIEELRVRAGLPAADHHRRPAPAARAGDARGAARVPHRRADPRLAAPATAPSSRPTSARCRASSIGRRVRSRRVDCVMTDEALGVARWRSSTSSGSATSGSSTSTAARARAPRRAAPATCEAMAEAGLGARPQVIAGEFTEEAGVRGGRAAAARGDAADRGLRRQRPRRGRADRPARAGRRADPRGRLGRRLRQHVRRRAHHVSLTTVNQPRHEMGRRGARAAARAHRRPRRAVVRLHEPTLVVRKTTGPAAMSAARLLGRGDGGRRALGASGAAARAGAAPPPSTACRRAGRPRPSSRRASRPAGSRGHRRPRARRRPRRSAWRTPRRRAARRPAQRPRRARGPRPAGRSIRTGAARSAPVALLARPARVRRAFTAIVRPDRARARAAPGPGPRRRGRPAATPAHRSSGATPAWSASSSPPPATTRGRRSGRRRRARGAAAALTASWVVRAAFAAPRGAERHHRGNGGSGGRCACRRPRASARVGAQTHVSRNTSRGVVGGCPPNRRYARVLPHTPRAGVEQRRARAPALVASWCELPGITPAFR